MEGPHAEGNSSIVADGAGARFRAGEIDVFRSVYEANVGRVHALAFRMSADAERARDLTQEVFLRAWSKRHTLRNGDALGAWLMKLAANVIISRNRGYFRRLKRELGMPASWEPEDEVELPDAATTFDLERSIAALPPGARAVFVLHDLEGFTHEEIGRIARIAPGTSKAQLHRARELLRREMSR